MTNDPITDRADMCVERCQTDQCAGGRRSCGSCCRCRARCQVARLREQMTHPLFSQAAQERIAAIDSQRDRQHDDEHTRGELAAAAASYALMGWHVSTAEAFWPWKPAGFKPKTAQENLVRAVQFLMAEWDRLERHRLMIEAMEHPVLPPRALCDGDQEIWYAGSGWWIQVFERENPADGWRARVYVDGPSPIVGVGNGRSQRAAAFEALQDAEVPDAERLASHWPDIAPSREGGGVGHIEIVMDRVESGMNDLALVHVATLLVDGMPKAEGRGATETQAKSQALLNAGIGFLQDGEQVTDARVPEWAKDLPAPDSRQAMSRGWNPDQAVVETGPFEVTVDWVERHPTEGWTAMVSPGPSGSGDVKMTGRDRRTALVEALRATGVPDPGARAESWLAAHPDAE